MSSMTVMRCDRSVLVAERALHWGFPEGLAKRIGVSPRLVYSILLERGQTFDFSDFAGAQSTMNLSDFMGEDRELLMYLAGQARGIELARTNKVPEQTWLG